MAAPSIATAMAISRRKAQPSVAAARRPADVPDRLARLPRINAERRLAATNEQLPVAVRLNDDSSDADDGDFNDIHQCLTAC
jgi:hypothetical protein